MIVRTFILIALLGVALPLTAFVGLADDKEADDKKAAAEAAAIARLVQALGADDFRAREAASVKLAAHGEAARSALEKAARTSESPEVRWRAEQLLRRLSGAGEKPLGAESGKAGKTGGTAGEVETAFERAKKLLEDILKRKNPAMTDPWRLLGKRKIEAPGLVLEKPLTGEAVLHVERKRDDGTKVEDVFKGHSLEDILARNPELKDHAGMEELKRREAEQSWPGLQEFLKRRGAGGIRLEPFQTGRSGFTFATSQGVEIKHDADGVTVKIREKDENGKEVVKEYKGKDLDEIKKKHPELKDKLGNVGFSFKVTTPNWFWPGGKPRRLDPLHPPVTPRTVLIPGQMIFGLTLAPPDEALASHLGLAKDAGALVVRVQPGSQAETLGIERNDVILKVNGQDVNRDTAADLLRKAGKDKSPLDIALIRRGKTITLKR